MWQWLRHGVAWHGRCLSFPSKREPRSKLARYAWPTGVLLALSLPLVLLWRGEAPGGPTANPSPSSAAGSQQLVRRERRPTLDPALFVGKAAAAHQVAREIPEVLDQLDASRMARAGQSVAEIRAYIDKKYGR